MNYHSAKIAKFCSELQTLTVQFELDEPPELEKLQTYCRLHQIKMMPIGEGGLLIRLLPHILHVYQNGLCMLTQAKSLNEGVSRMDDFLTRASSNSVR